MKSPRYNGGDFIRGPPKALAIIWHETPPL